jgi:hypothetical protein
VLNTTRHQSLVLFHRDQQTRSSYKQHRRFKAAPFAALPSSREPRPDPRRRPLLSSHLGDIADKPKPAAQSNQAVNHHNAGAAKWRRRNTIRPKEKKKKSGKKKREDEMKERSPVKPPP